VIVGQELLELRLDIDIQTFGVPERIVGIESNEFEATSRIEARS
jgi:hypothetical protein